MVIVAHPKSRQSEESIPATQETIRAAVLREMRDWLLQVKNQTGKVGKYAMSLAIKKNERAQERLEGSNDDLETADAIPDRESEEGNTWCFKRFNTWLITLDLDLIVASDAHIDFTPLHQCLHIHNVLGKRNLLKLIYDENRRLQADLLLKRSFDFQGEDLEPFESYLENMAGFFIVEAIVMESTTDLRSRNHVMKTFIPWENRFYKLIGWNALGRRRNEA
jgi:hypothetical protein